jgi:hypothetical protein
MILAVDTEDILDSIISSYETRIQGVESLFESTNQILQGFQDLVFDTRQERQEINNRLRENLAQNGSLRKKDFDGMMSEISLHQDRREQEIRNLSKSYLSEQKKLVQELRGGLRNFTRALAQGEVQRVNEFHKAIRDILDRQEMRKHEVTSKLTEFQKEQQETAKMLRDLLDKGRKLRIKDFKSMLTEFKRQRKERVARHEERRKEVKDMLGEFRNRRAETIQNRLVEQTAEVD